MEDDGFTLVKQRSHATRKHIRNQKITSGLPVSIDEHSLKSLRLSFQDSGFAKNFLALVDNAVVRVIEQSPSKVVQNTTCSSNSSSNAVDIACYGLGNFSACIIARYQLCFLLAMRNSLQKKYVTPCVEVYDPKFTEQEKSYLEEQQIKVLTVNEEGCRTVNGCTIFYEPHCGRALYNNLLWSNWSCNKLSNIILIGNSFNAMQERTPQRKFSVESRYISDIIPFCEESPVVNNFSELDVFNDTSVHTFKLSTMSEASRTMWENNSKPLCKNDPEIITC